MPNLLTQDQVRALCVKVGFTPADAKIAAAIAMCEAPASKGGVAYADFDLVGDQALANSVWGYSYGAFQVRSRRAEAGKGTARDERLLPDPAFNCASALKIKNSEGWGAWTTYRTGQYQAYLPDDFPPPAGMYVVVYGDTLSKIAARFKIGWADLARVNGIRSPYRIFIGERLILPWVEHTVQRGETLSGIVDEYGDGVTVARVAEFNKITNPNLISVGQVIKIPRAAL